VSSLCCTIREDRVSWYSHKVDNVDWHWNFCQLCWRHRVEGREEELVEVLGAAQPEGQTQVQQSQQGTRQEEEEHNGPYVPN